MVGGPWGASRNRQGVRPPRGRRACPPRHLRDPEGGARRTTGRWPDVANECFMSVILRGGIRTVGKARRLHVVGADWVAPNSAAVSDPQLVRQAADRFGSRCISAGELTPGPASLVSKAARRARTAEAISKSLWRVGGYHTRDSRCPGG